MFTSEDLKQFQAKGIHQEVVEQQLTYFRSGFPYLKIDRPAKVGDGILKLDAQEIEKLEQTYAKKVGNRKVFKFVPASGAATRMFKDLFEFLHADGDEQNNAIQEIFNKIDDFAFSYELQQILLQQNIKASDKKKIAAAILLNSGLNYGNMPKGMLLFHKYKDDSRTAIEEHLVEGANYALNADGTVNLHFTVSPEHLHGFQTLINSKLKKYSDIFSTRFNVYFSQQKPSTDIIAVDGANQPIRNNDGTILFRPGGHGALLENLNEIDADIIFIKNIDNVVPDKLKSITEKYKKAIAGLLIELQEKITYYAKLIREDNYSNEEILSFLSNNLSFQMPADAISWNNETFKAYFLKTLNRPIRVCGMVKNVGEPGGGPFWVRNADGSTSLQIAESSQIDANDQRQQAMAAEATHFNPVDLVCAVKNSNGKRFNLPDYRDPDTGFISKKSKDGIELKAQELPGLWNGAMALWNTVFVETPIETFNPVKTVNDLLRPQHQ